MRQFELQCKGPEDTEWSTLNVRRFWSEDTSLAELAKFKTQWQQHPEFADHQFRVIERK